MTLNGINQTNLTFHRIFDTTSTCGPEFGAAGNLVYNGVITAQDANGNKATNTFTFNTWRSDSPFIEAEDYNFNWRVFSPHNSFPDSYNSILGCSGVNGSIIWSMTPSGRYQCLSDGDLPELETAADIDHATYTPDMDMPTMISASSNVSNSRTILA